jgi:hypothetical protein
MSKFLVKIAWLGLKEIPGSSCTSLMVNLQLAVTNHALLPSFLLERVYPEHLRHSVGMCPCLKLKNHSENCVWLLLASFQKAVLIIQ